jgi:hypothetical protein
MTESPLTPPDPIEPDAATPAPVREDVPYLDYRNPVTSNRTDSAGDGCLYVMVGALYAMAAVGVCWWIISSQPTTGYAPPTWILTVPATVLLGLPFLVGLFFRAGRRMAIGIFVVTVLALFFLISLGGLMQDMYKGFGPSH